MKMPKAGGPIQLISRGTGSFLPPISPTRRLISALKEDEFVILRPDGVLQHDVLKEDEFVVLRSDGLFDVMTSKELVTFLHHRIMNIPGIGRRRDAVAKFLADLSNS
jgi:serine/threonine protein phosphatase PrpC